MKIKIKYMDGVEEVKQAHAGEWYDLRCAEDVYLHDGEFKMISLGVSIELPRGYEAHVLPRSSTFKRYGILMANGMGIIDNSYCGDNDVWQFPALATEEMFIPKNERIAQFRIVKCQRKAELVRVLHFGNKNRGGFGSTGRR